MRLTLASRLSCPAKVAWAAELKVEFLNELSWPFLLLQPLRPDEALPKKRIWREGERLRFKAKLFGVMPLGFQDVRVVELNHENLTLVTCESGGIISFWRHRVRIRDRGPQSCLYSDEIEMRAGLLTPFVWSLACIFYRYRHYRRVAWARLAGGAGG